MKSSPGADSRFCSCAHVRSFSLSLFFVIYIRCYSSRAHCHSLAMYILNKFRESNRIVARVVIVSTGCTFIICAVRDTGAPMCLFPSNNAVCVCMCVSIR